MDRDNLALSLTEKEQCIYSNKIKVVSRKSDCAVFRQKDQNGEIVKNKYSVFPGIDLIYNDINTHESIANEPKSDTVFEINHCKEGRIESEFNNEFYYLTPGDLSISCRSHTGYGSYFPLRHYQGITIKIDISKAPKCLSCFLDDVNVSPENLMKKFNDGGKIYISRSNASIEHIFSELYSVPDEIKKGYFKVKILELLLFLTTLDVSKNENAEHSVSRSHVTFAKEICKYLTDHMESRVTIEMLSEVFHVSGTSIKTCFKSVYGVSLYSYIRTQKMQQAAIMLKTTDLNILEIAGRLGYDNGSKFAKAFRDCYNTSPNDYRKNKLS